MATKKRKKRRPQRARSNTSDMYASPNSHQLILSKYEITDELVIEDHTVQQLPAQVRDQLEDLFDKVNHAPKEVIPELEHLLATYPHVSLFYNYLNVAYLKVNDMEKVTALALEAYRRHPKHLFARINYANICLYNDEITKIPRIFGHKLNLKSLYPRRERFHTSEFIGFAGVVCRYYCAIDDRDTATIYYKRLKQIAPRDSTTKLAKRTLYPPFWLRWRLRWAERKSL